MGTHELSRAEKRAVLAVTCGTSFMFPFMGSSVNVALPSIGVELNMSAVQLAWVATAFLLTSAILLVPLGRLGVMKGRKQILMAGVATYVAGSTFAAFASSGATLIASRAIQGAGGAMLASTSIAIVSESFGPGERGRALGINAAALYSGLSFGPAIGGIVTQAFGWRVLFFINIPLGLALLLAAWRKLPHQRPVSPDTRFDFKGLTAYAIFLLGLMYGATKLPESQGFILIAVGMIALAVLIVVERRSETPLVDIALFRTNVVFAMSNVAGLLNYSATFATAFLLSLYLQIVTGLSPGRAGLVLISMPLVQAIVSPLAGRLSDRIEPRILASSGMALSALALLAMSRLDANTPVQHIVAALLLFGLGVGLFSSPNTNAVMTSVPPQKYGLASATLATMRQIGMVLSMALATLVIGSYIGEIAVGSTPIGPFVSAIRLTFFICMIACFAGIFASFSRGRIHSTDMGDSD
ncbi:MAG: MFS transporter [Dehalococcoidia bacterium]|nr:MFS transporter [Dehalococcoidia bacterium]